MTFCTAINCMDGRVQLPVIHYLQQRFNVVYVDAVTEPGPVKLLAEEQGSDAVASIRHRVDISLNKHGSVGVAIVTHYDCAGNPLPRSAQMLQLDKAMAFAHETWPDVTIIGLWLDEEWVVSEVR